MFAFCIAFGLHADLRDSKEYSEAVAYKLMADCTDGQNVFTDTCDCKPPLITHISGLCDNQACGTAINTEEAGTPATTCVCKAATPVINLGKTACIADSACTTTMEVSEIQGVKHCVCKTNTPVIDTGATQCIAVTGSCAATGYINLAKTACIADCSAESAVKDPGNKFCMCEAEKVVNPAKSECIALPATGCASGYLNIARTACVSSCTELIYGDQQSQPSASSKECTCKPNTIRIATGAGAVEEYTLCSPVETKVDLTKTAVPNSMVTNVDGTKKIAVAQICLTATGALPTAQKLHDATFSYFTSPVTGGNEAICTCSVLSKDGATCVRSSQAIETAFTTTSGSTVTKTFGTTNILASTATVAQVCGDGDNMDLIPRATTGVWGYGTTDNSIADTSFTSTQETLRGIQVVPKMCVQFQLYDLKENLVPLAKIDAKCRTSAGFRAAECDVRALCNGTDSEANPAKYDIFIGPDNFTATCRCAVQGIDGTCKPRPVCDAVDTRVDQCTPAQLKAACGSNTVGKNYTQDETLRIGKYGSVLCECDFSAGAVFNFDSSACLSPAECMGIINAEVDYDNKVCKCQKYGYTGSKCADEDQKFAPTTYCPWGYVKRLDGICVIENNDAAIDCAASHVQIKAIAGKLNLRYCACDDSYLVNPIRTDCIQQTQVVNVDNKLKTDSLGNASCTNSEYSYDSTQSKCLSTCPNVLSKLNGAWQCTQKCSGTDATKGGLQHPNPGDISEKAIMETCTCGDSTKYLNLLGTCVSLASDSGSGTNDGKGLTCGATSNSQIDEDVFAKRKVCILKDGFIFLSNGAVATTDKVSPSVRYNSAFTGAAITTPASVDLLKGFQGYTMVEATARPVKQGCSWVLYSDATAATDFLNGKKVGTSYRLPDNTCAQQIQASGTTGNCVTGADAAKAKLCFDETTAILLTNMKQQCESTIQGATITQTLASDAALGIKVAAGEFVCACPAGQMLQIKEGVKKCVSVCEAGFHADVDPARLVIGDSSLRCYSNTQKCSLPGHVLDFTQTKCIKASECGSNSAIEIDGAGKWVKCTCSGDHPYLAADITVPRCVQTCGNFPYENYLKSGVKHCATARQPEYGWECENFPVPKLKLFDGSCVRLECDAAGKNCSTNEGGAYAANTTQCGQNSKYDITSKVDRAGGEKKPNTDYTYACACESLNYVLNLVGTQCIPLASCTTKGGVVLQASNVGANKLVQVCSCSGFSFQADACMTQACNSSCKCPVGQLLTFQGKCVTLGDPTTLCGQNSMVPALMNNGAISYYQCKCQLTHPFLSATDRSKCIASCTVEEANLPSNTDGMNNKICATTACTDVTSPTSCLCNHDAGFINKNGLCESCDQEVPDGTPIKRLVNATRTECLPADVTECPLGFVRNNTQSRWCITTASCLQTTGQDGLLRVVSLNGSVCVDRTTCISESLGAISNGKCLCGEKDFSLPFIVIGDRFQCTNYDYKGQLADNIACPYGMFLGFNKRCIACPAGGCSDKTATEALCGASTRFVLTSIKDSYRCSCVDAYYIKPNYNGCVKSCDASTEETMAISSVFKANDACICKTETPTYREGENVCRLSCGSNPYLTSFDQKTRICVDKCPDVLRVGYCQCEDAKVLTLGGLCVDYSSSDPAGAAAVCGVNTVVDSINKRCACKDSGYVIGLKFDGCVTKDDCVTRYNVLNSERKTATHCIAKTACKTAIDLTRTYCVAEDAFKGVDCGSLAKAVDKQCVCENPDYFVSPDGGSCQSQCASNMPFNDKKRCFNYQTTQCTGECRCQKSKLLQLSGECTDPTVPQPTHLPKLRATNACNVAGATIKEVDGYKMCECSGANAFINEAKTECVAACDASSPYRSPMNDQKFCQPASCTNKDHCLCDFFNGQYNKNGVCDTCGKDTYVSFDRVCTSSAQCAAGEVAFGRHCIKAQECTEDGLFIDVSAKTCAAQCSAHATANAEKICACDSKFKLSKDGMTCVKKGLSGGAIAGIVISCVVVVGAAIGVTVFCVMKKKGKCGSKKASKAPSGKTMGDVVTGNNETALAPASK